jgi:L-galactose dehydrogenase
VNETLPALLKLKEEGKVKYIGITGFPMKIFRGVLERLDRNLRPNTIDTILSYCHYSLNNVTLQDEFPFLQDHGVGIINASSLSMGLLTRHGAPKWHPAPQSIKGTSYSMTI